MAIPAPGDPDATARRAALGLILLATLIRLGGLLATPLELYPDEAQYWVWSRHLAFGYFAKPPMVAWMIALTTRLGGDSEPYVRAAAVFLNGGSAITLFFLGRRLYGAWTGALASTLFVLMPGVAISSLVISTDAPLMFFASLALLAYVRLQTMSGGATGRGRIITAAGLGLALGLAMLSKYAALYLIVGLAAHLIIDRDARRVWRWPAAVAALVAFALPVAPNLAWNAAHHFQTVVHTAANANLTHGKLFSFSELGQFLGAQFGVFGPVPLLVLLAGLVIAARARVLEAADKLLVCAMAPALIVVTILAFLSRANANWAAIAYVPGVVLAAAWLMRWRQGTGRLALLAKGALIATLVIQAAIAGLVVAATVSPRLADKVGAAGSLKRMRGWRQTAEAVVNRAMIEQAVRGLSAVAVDDRLLFNSLRYYGRDYFDRPDAAPLRKWSSAGDPPISQAEAEAGLTPAEGGRVLAVSMVEAKRPMIAADFARTADTQIQRVFLDRNHVRRLDMFIGEGFRAAQTPPVPKR
ncbi:MAG: 4-amino-4-deoxy-L-arabinose transferase [Caulobacter sp.]|nr:4-amino-4-deoxy-L-arabinose transferase [Caulobacter sp.]